MSVTAAPSTPGGGDGFRAAVHPSAIEARAKVAVRSALPGRFRVWVPGLYHNEAMKREIEAAFDRLHPPREREPGERHAAGSCAARSARGSAGG